MGSAPWWRPSKAKDDPSVGLLNIGEGRSRAARPSSRPANCCAPRQQRPPQLPGNVEGNDIFKGTTDIVVCDGFVGNVALKTAEGLASMLSSFIKQEFTRNVFTKLAALVALPVLKHFKARVDHRRYNGAALLGLRGLVFKSHGSADAFAFQRR